MSPHSTFAPLYNGPPLDDHNRTFLEWKPLFISQADGHEFTQFYMNKAYVPSDLERSILSILDDDVQDGLAAWHKVIADHVQSVKSSTLKSETAKSLSRLRALALNRGLPAESQKVKYHDGDCLDTLLADVKSIASQYRTAMIPSSLEITAAEYDAFLWANHYMVKLSEVFLDDKQIRDPIRVISSNAKASGQPCSVAAIDAAIKDALATRHLRSLALCEHGTADSAPTRSHLINAAVVDATASPIIRVVPNATVFRKKCSKNTSRSPHDVCRLAKFAMIILVVTTTTVTTAMTAVAEVQAPLADEVVAPRRSAFLLAVVVATAVEMTAIALGAMKAIEAPFRLSSCSVIDYHREVCRFAQLR
ncbi:hypothetical protein H257_16539 [Aphanomyces astaci]|uniref:Uncharacterized protein n=1 Tax=Aphanomyces astaci TaxID=112090 RepID=W4FKB5_APHAT|nr:hypothetical protein H257_16539 [Aphanomyces astaci]ETV67306.1 hypothetical protein H257_16539 [Aphanomyces astaci]|eukprot:XP_009843294.1 hypothetical protein H257_16539 [Aphanomyces astaci]